MSLLDCNKLQNDDYAGELNMFFKDNNEFSALIQKCIADGDIVTDPLV